MTASHPIRISYLCLQATREGQASYAHVNEIVGGLKRRGCSVTVFEPDYSRGRLPGPLGRALQFWQVQRRLRVAARDADIVYIRAHFAAYPTAMWARRRGIPVIQEVNGPYEDLFIAWPQTARFKKLFVYLMRRQYAVANQLIAVTDGLGTWLAADTGAKNAWIIPNGANIDVFRSGLPVPDGLPSRYVVFFGALARWQGIDTILEATNDSAWPNDVSLVIIGDGAARAAAEAAAARDPRVVYLGAKLYRELPAYVANAIAGLVVSQDRVGTGLSPLKSYETLACGVPSIVSDTPGLRDLVAQEACGIVVPVADSLALAAAVAHLAAHPKAAAEMGRRGREAVAARHSWDARAADTLRVIESVLAQDGRW